MTVKDDNDTPENSELSDSTGSSEPHQPKFTIGGASTNFSDDDSPVDELPAQQTTVIGAGDDQDGNQVQVIGLQYQAEKQEEKNYTSESQLEKKRQQRERRLRQLKYGLIFVAIIAVFAVLAWYLLSSV